MNNPYTDNPFDSIPSFAAPNAVAAPSSTPTPVSPQVKQQQAQQQQQALDDLINPFAVLGMENKSVKSPSGGPSPRATSGQYASQQPTGAGWNSPHASSASPFASSSPLSNPYASQPGMQMQQPQAIYAAVQQPMVAAPQVYAPPQQQQQQWNPTTTTSPFQPPPQIITTQAYSPAASPSFTGNGSSPSSIYGAASPAYGTYSPASPAFMSGPPTQQQGYASPSGSPFGGSQSKHTVVTDADLNLFSSPVVAVVKTPTKAATPTPTPAPAPQQTHTQAQEQQNGWAPTASPQPNDGWDNDDFGIQWEAPKQKASQQQQQAHASAPTTSSSGSFNSASSGSKEGGEVSSPKKNTISEVSSPSKRVNATDAAIAAEHKTEGNVLARISVRTLIVKEWKETFWIINQQKLLLYRSKEDYLYNPVGVMVKKDIPLRDNLRCSEVTCKPYKGYGDLYHFTLEEMLDYGPSLIAKFASTDVKAIRELRAVIIAYIIAERKKRVGGNAGVRRPTPTAVTGPEGGTHTHTHTSPTARSSPRAVTEGGDKYAKWGQINS